MRCAAVLFALTGCSSIFGLHDPTRATAADAPLDVTDGPMPDGQMCVGHGELAVCFDTPPTSSVQLPAVINTSDTSACTTIVHWASSQQPEVCFIAGIDVTQSGTTTVTGARPLVVIATGTIHIMGLVDASSHLAGGLGAAANAAACGAFATLPQQSNTGGGGGAGGTFISAGGIGGAGDSDTTLGGHPAAPVAASPVLRGGCPGQAGAPGAATTPPGDGGGALYLAAGGQLALDAARIAANGAGARSGFGRAGGAGGGAGGMIVLDAPTITVTNAFLSANGGGGSSGADAGGGSPGSDPDPANPTVPAPGGATGKGGPGGAGAAGATGAVDGGDTPPGTARGGGGGGGGFGVIYGPSGLGVSDVTASPAITTLP